VAFSNLAFVTNAEGGVVDWVLIFILRCLF